MASLFDDEVLLLRPLNERVSAAVVEDYLDKTPGAFRDPLDNSTWYLAQHPQQIEELRKTRIDNPTRYLAEPRVIVSPQDIVVVPGVSGRGRKFVHWLLSQSSCELSVHGRVVGRVTKPSEIYADETWEDPEASADPTESLPRVGSLVVVMLNRADRLESVAVHSSGVMSYEQLRPVDDPEKTYRRMAPEQVAHWQDLVRRLALQPETSDSSEPISDPVLVRIESPTEVVDIFELDSAHPHERDRDFLSLVEGWSRALREDRGAVLPGLLPYP